jgi:hypothetical protein
MAHDDEAPVEGVMDGDEQVVLVKDVHTLRVNIARPDSQRPCQRCPNPERYFI